MLRGRHVQKSCKIRKIIYHVIKFCFLKLWQPFPFSGMTAYNIILTCLLKEYLSDNYKSSKVKKIANMKLSLKGCNLRDLICLFSNSLSLVKNKNYFTKRLNLRDS